MTTLLHTVNAQFDRFFPDIPRDIPRPITLEEAAQEAEEGLFSEGERDE